jgi:hypothetical protein
MEPGYEDHPNSFNVEKGWLDQHDVRRSCWWAFCAGASGYTYGCHDVWQMFSDHQPVVNLARRHWTEALALPGASQVQHARRLFESRPYASRVPDQELIRSNRGGTDHIAACRDEDGSYAVIYIPAEQRVTIDLSRLSGSQIRAWWYNPRTGAPREIGLFEKTEQQFQPPWDPEGRDWVLVLDDVARGSTSPGSLPSRP